MFVHVTRRAQMSDLLSGRTLAGGRAAPLLRHAELPELDGQGVAGIWSRDPANHAALPEVLLTADGQERDWLAWLATFAPTLRPFTAYCRVLGISVFRELQEAAKEPALGRIENACVGLILGEVLSSEEVLARLREPFTASSCASALSFALTRELAMHSRRVFKSEHLPGRWSLVRQLTRQRERTLDVGEIVAVAEVLRALACGGVASGVDPVLLPASQQVLEAGELNLGSEGLGSGFDAAAREMTGPREDRVAAFERALRHQLTNKGPQVEGFAWGYLASRINPGSITHAPLLASVLQRAPSALLWYGVLAGFAADSGVLSEFGGIGRRVLRDLVMADDLVGRPRADLAAGELEILLGVDRAGEFSVTSPSQIVVELEPRIWTVVNWSSRMRSRRTTDTIDREDERGLIASELAAAISRLVDLHHRVRGHDVHERDPRQERLFPEPPGRRPKRR